MIKVSPNRFFIKNVPPSGSMIPLLEEYTDLSLQANSATLDFSTGDRNITHVVSGNTQNPLTNGLYDLVGGTLRSYVSGADVTTMGEPLDLTLYAFKEDFKIAEGGLGFLSNTKASPGEAIYSSHYPSGGNIYMEDNFDGAASALEYTRAPMPGSFGRRPYVFFDECVEILADKFNWSKKKAKASLAGYVTPETEYHGTSPVMNDDQRVWFPGLGGKRRWKSSGQWAPGTGWNLDGGSGRIYLKRVTEKRFNWSGEHRWIPMKVKENKTIGTEPDIRFRWKEIDGHVKYDEIRELPTGDENEERQSANNTIFDDVMTTKNVNNPWSADLTNPLIYSTLNLSKTEGQEMGNAAHVNHIWDHASGNLAIQEEFGRSEDVNGQTARLGIWNVPVPLITDAGNNKQGDRRTYFPEISLDMRVDQLPPTVFYGCGASVVVEGEEVGGFPAAYSADNIHSNPLISYSESGGITIVSGETNLYVSPANSDIVVGMLVSGTGIQAGTTITNIDVPTIPVMSSTGTVSGVPATTFSSMTTGTSEVMVYAQATGATQVMRAATATKSIGDYCANKCESLLRSIAITFSNYKPLPSHNTLDEFLNYGLNNFYINGRTRDGIVGGLLFKTYGSVYNDTGDAGDPVTGSTFPSFNKENMFVQALPVTEYYDLNGASKGVEAGKIYEHGGFVRLSTALYEPGVDNGGVEHSASQDDDYLLRLGMGSWISAYQAGLDWASPPFFQEIDMGSFFKIRFFWDVLAECAKETYSRTPYSALSTGSSDRARNSGPVLRAVFESGIGGTDPSSSDEEEYKFIDIPFPMSWMGDPQVDSYTLLDSEFGTTGNTLGTSNSALIWPRYMTIWVNNFRWVMGSDNTRRSAEGYLPADTHFHFGDMSPDGAAQEVDMFIDNITIKDFTPSVSNHTPTNKKIGPWAIKSSSLESPLFTISGSGSGPDARKLVCFNSASGTAQPTQNVAGYHSKNPSQALLFGWDDPADMPSPPTQYDTGTASQATDTITGTGTTFTADMVGGNFIFDDETVGGEVLTYASATEITVDSSQTVTTQGYVINLDGAVGGEVLTYTSATEITVDSSQTVTTQEYVIYLDGGSGYALFSDFSTLDFPNINQFNYPLSSGLPSGGLLSMGTDVVTNGIDYLGQQFMGAHYTSGTAVANWRPATDNNLSGAAFDVTDAGTVVDNKFTIASGSNSFLSTDAFTQKGFAYLNVSGNAGDATTVDYGNWGKREHAAASVKIVSWGGAGMDNELDTNQLIVSDNSIFNPLQNDEYVIYRAYAPFETQALLTGVRLAGEGAVEGNTITFNKMLLSATSGNRLLQERFAAELYISPYKYWMTMIYSGGPDYGNGSNDELPTARSYGSIGFVTGTPNDASLSTYTGTTFNESLYSYHTGSEGTPGRSGLSNRMWDISFDNTISDLQLMQDYGNGPYDTEAAEGGNIDTKTTVANTYVDFTMDRFVQNRGTDEDNTFLLYWRMKDRATNLSVSLYSPAYTDSGIGTGSATLKVPRFYWEYLDEPPALPTLSVGPAVDLLKKDADLYELTTENLNAVKFEWDEKEDDIWYRYMIFNSGSIANKYEGARLWIPLNEEPPDQDLTTLATYNLYDVVSGTSDTMQNGDGADGEVYSDLDGIAGWAPHFISGGASSLQYLIHESGTNFSFPFGSAAETEKFSIMAHCTPVSGTAQQYAWILAKGQDAIGSGTPYTGGIGIYINGASGNVPKVVVKHATTTLTSSIIPNDGSPLNIIYTYNSGSSTGPDAHLYVNGVLEDYADSCVALTATEKDLYIGTSLAEGDAAPSTSQMFEGTIEEIVFYNHELHVPQNPKEYIYSTAGVEDLASDSLITHTARLFLCDFHNIRGKSLKELSYSNQVSWRATTL